MTLIPHSINSGGPGNTKLARQVLRLALAVALFPLGASAQLSYGYTTFLHGFNDDSARFTRPNTAGLLSSWINLKTPEFPNTNGSLTIDDQAAELFSRISADQGGAHVLVGHSMGGLTARATYFQHPSIAAGIITIGSPHQGAPIADNATQVSGYVGDEVSDFFDNVSEILLSVAPGSILSRAAVTLLQSLSHDYISGRIKDFLNAEFGLKSAGLNDIKTNSPTVARLNNSLDPLPHANVLGTIGRRNAVFRVAFSASYNDGGFDPFIHNKNRVKSLVKACRQIGWNIIIRTAVGRACNQIDNAIGSIDDRWAFWTMGLAEKRNPNATFDGLVPTSHSRYPGTSLSDPTVTFIAGGANHMNLQYDSRGITQLVRAMEAIHMDPPPPPPPPPGTIASVRVFGPTEVQNGCGNSWEASPYGGIAPYTYLWTVNGMEYDTGSDPSVWYTPSSNGSFSVQVTVTDSQGSTGSASVTVNVVSGNCT